MRRLWQSVALGLAIAAAHAQNAPDARHSSDPKAAQDAAEIRAKILRGAEGFMTGNPDLILAHYARDVILSYPGVPDMDYATLERGYAQLRNRPRGVSETTTPTFEEILVSDDMAVVRLMWTTTTTVARPPSTARRRLKDLQVWRREADGRWMFARGMHYRMPEPDSAR